MSGLPMMPEMDSEPAAYAWRLTKDHVEDGRAVGLEGPADPGEFVQRIVRHLATKSDRVVDATVHAVRFRLYNDDDTLYFEGILAGKDVTQMEPLDDFGRPGADCTRIDVYEQGRWKTVGASEHSTALLDRVTELEGILSTCQAVRSKELFSCDMCGAQFDAMAPLVVHVAKRHGH